MKQPTTPTTPFAMRCTQEQFDDVKEELEKYQRIYKSDNFLHKFFPGIYFPFLLEIPKPPFIFAPPLPIFYVHAYAAKKFTHPYPVQF